MAETSANVMKQMIFRIRMGQGKMRALEPESNIVNTNLGPCLIMGGLSWLLLFSLYHWLA